MRRNSVLLTIYDPKRRVFDPKHTFGEIVMSEIVKCASFQKKSPAAKVCNLVDAAEELVQTFRKCKTSDEKKGFVERCRKVFCDLQAAQQEARRRNNISIQELLLVTIMKFKGILLILANREAKDRCFS